MDLSGPSTRVFDAKFNGDDDARVTLCVSERFSVISSSIAKASATKNSKIVGPMPSCVTNIWSSSA